MSKIIFVTNPSKQHTPNLVHVLSKMLDGNVIWLSSILFNPPFFLRKWFFLQQRRSFLVSENQMIIPTQWWLREIILRLLFKGERRNFIRDRLHDAWVCHRVKKYQPYILIGSEKSCKDSFLAVKKYNGICILDLAQIHVNELDKIRNEHLFLKKEWGNDFLFENIKKIKLIEYDLADYILVISSKMKYSLLKAGISGNKIFSVTLGFNPQVFYKNPCRPIINNHRLQLIFVGNLSEAKGVSFLLKIMKRLLPFPVSLTLIGSNAHSFRSKTNLPNIAFTGILDQLTIANYLRNADVFVFPSFLDSWGMAVIEAMAAGLPVIASDGVGAATCIDEHSGFILPIEQDQWIKAILALYFNPSLRINMGLQASDKVASLTWENYQNDLKLCLNEVIS